MAAPSPSGKASSLPIPRGWTDIMWDDPMEPTPLAPAALAPAVGLGKNHKKKMKKQKRDPEEHASSQYEDGAGKHFCGEEDEHQASLQALPRGAEGVCNSILSSMGKAARDETMGSRRRLGTAVVADGGGDHPGIAVSEGSSDSSDDEAGSDGEELNLDSIISRAPFKSMIQELFSDDSLAPPPITVITKSYEESYMREPISADERPCVMDTKCECNVMFQEDGFVAVEMLLPNEKLSSSSDRQMCVLCLRKATQSLYYELIYSGVPYRGIIQKYGVICGQPFEYAKEVCLVCPPNGPVQCMPYPIVAHQRNRYKIVIRNGSKHMVQINMTHQDFRGSSGQKSGGRQQQKQHADHQTSHDTKTAATKVPMRNPDAAGPSPPIKKGEGNWATRSSNSASGEGGARPVSEPFSSSLQSAARRTGCIGFVKGVSRVNHSSGGTAAHQGVGARRQWCVWRRSQALGLVLARARRWRIKQLRAHAVGADSRNNGVSIGGPSSGSVIRKRGRCSVKGSIGAVAYMNKSSVGSSGSSSISISCGSNSGGGEGSGGLPPPPRAGGGARGEGLLYCPWNRCLDERIARLQQRALAGDNGAEKALDSCAQACAWLCRCFPCCGSVEKVQTSGSRPQQQQASPEPGTARMVLVCYCGLPEHDLRLVKRNYFHQFPSVCRPPAFITPPAAPGVGRCAGKRRRVSQERGGGGCAGDGYSDSGGDDDDDGVARQHARAAGCWQAAPRVLMQSILPMLPLPREQLQAPQACVAVQAVAEQLPDLGVFIRAALHQSFFGAQLLKSNQKAWDNLVQRDSFRKGSRPVRGPGSDPGAPAGGEGACSGQEEDEEEALPPLPASPRRSGSSSIRRAAVRMERSTEAARAGERKLQPPLLQQAGDTLCSVLVLESVHVLRKFMKTHRSVKLPARFDRWLSLASSSSSSQSSWSLNHLPESAMSLHRELDLCIRVVMSSLLKLTPLGCKRPTFLGRVTLWSRFVALLGAEASAKSFFVQNHLSLVKACFCEYVLNMLVHSMPCELEALLPSDALSSRQYKGAVVAMCDNLRQDCLVTGAEPWVDLDRNARKKMDKCTRAVKFSSGHTGWQHQQVARGRQPSCADPRLGPATQRQSLGSPVLDANDTGGRLDALRVLNPSWTDDMVSTVAYVHSSLRSFPLPREVGVLQGETLEALHSMCFIRAGMARRIMLCLWCAITGKKIKTKLRTCCRTGSYSCDVCGAADVLCINMHGVLLKIGTVAYYLCPCCGQLKMWEGGGEDLCPGLSAASSSAAAGALPWDNAWGDEQGRWARLARRRAVLFAADPAESGRCAIPTRPLPRLRGHWDRHQSALPYCCQSQQAGSLPLQPEAVPKCLVCGCRSQPRAMMMLPDVHRMVVVRCSFCIKHSLPLHARRCIQNTLDLERFLKDLYHDSGSGTRLKSGAARPRSKQQQQHRGGSSTGGSSAAPGPLF